MKQLLLFHSLLVDIKVASVIISDLLIIGPCISFSITPLLLVCPLSSWCYQSTPSMDCSASCFCVPRSGWQWASTSPCSSTIRGGEYTIQRVCVCVCCVTWHFISSVLWSSVFLCIDSKKVPSVETLQYSHTENVFLGSVRENINLEQFITG